MAAPIDMLGLIHKLTAEKFLHMIENGVEVTDTDKEVRDYPLPSINRSRVGCYHHLSKIQQHYRQRDRQRRTEGAPGQAHWQTQEHPPCVR